MKSSQRSLNQKLWEMNYQTQIIPGEWFYSLDCLIKRKTLTKMGWESRRRRVSEFVNVFSHLMFLKITERKNNMREWSESLLWLIDGIPLYILLIFLMCNIIGVILCLRIYIYCVEAKRISCEDWAQVPGNVSNGWRVITNESTIILIKDWEKLMR